MRILVALSLLTGCFSDPPPAGGGEESSSTADPTSTSAATASSSATASTSVATTGTSIETSTASDTGACEPRVIDNVGILRQPVNLFIVALPSITPEMYSPVPAGLLDVLLGSDAEDLRMVFGSDGTGVPPVSPKHICPSCAKPELCSSTIHRTLTTDAFIGELLSAAFLDSFACVLHPMADEPRGRMLVVAGDANEVVGDELETIESVAATGPPTDVDLICPGCSSEGMSGVEQLVATYGGFIYDLDAGQLPDAMFRAAIAPPLCLWPVSDEVEPPLSLADLQIIVDACGDPEPCPLEFEQVTGAGACDGMPVIPQFYVTPDLFAPGVSAVTLCPDACEGIRRAATLSLTVDHVYNCPE